MVSPGEAVRVSGENSRLPLPTSMSWVVLVVLELEAVVVVVAGLEPELWARVGGERRRGRRAMRVRGDSMMA